MNIQIERAEISSIEVKFPFKTFINTPTNTESDKKSLQLSFLFCFNPTALSKESISICFCLFVAVSNKELH